MCQAMFKYKADEFVKVNGYINYIYLVHDSN